MNKPIWICYQGLHGLINSEPEKETFPTPQRRVVVPFTSCDCPHDVASYLSVEDYHNDHLAMEFEYRGKKLRKGRRTVHVYELVSINGKTIF